MLAYIAFTCSIRFCKHHPGLEGSWLKDHQKKLTNFLKIMYKGVAPACHITVTSTVDKNEQKLYE